MWPLIVSVSVSSWARWGFSAVASSGSRRISGDQHVTELSAFHVGLPMILSALFRILCRISTLEHGTGEIFCGFFLTCELPPLHTPPCVTVTWPWTALGLEKISSFRADNIPVHNNNNLDYFALLPHPWEKILFIKINCILRESLSMSRL